MKNILISVDLLEKYNKNPPFFLLSKHFLKTFFLTFLSFKKKNPRINGFKTTSPQQWNISGQQ